MSQPKADGDFERQLPPPVPRCQYCGCDPAILYPISCDTPPFRITTVYCGNPQCRAIFGSVVTGRTDGRTVGGIVIPS